MFFVSLLFGFCDKRKDRLGTTYKGFVDVVKIVGLKIVGFVKIVSFNFYSRVGKQEVEYKKREEIKGLPFTVLSNRSYCLFQFYDDYNSQYNLLYDFFFYCVFS